MASKTEGFQADKLSAATEGSLGIPFLRAAVTAPMQLYEHRAKEREKTMQLQMTTTQPQRQVMMSQPHKWEQGEAEKDEEGGDDRQKDQDTDGEGWDTRPTEGAWEDQEEGQGAEDFGGVGEGWEVWGHKGRNKDVFDEGRGVMVHRA